MKPRVGLPHSFGWVRAPEKDTPYVDAYEMPSGEFYFVIKGKSFVVIQREGQPLITRTMMSKGQAQ